MAKANAFNPVLFSRRVLVALAAYSLACALALWSPEGRALLHAFAPVAAVPGAVFAAVLYGRAYRARARHGETVPARQEARAWAGVAAGCLLYAVGVAGSWAAWRFWNAPPGVAVLLHSVSLLGYAFILGALAALARPARPVDRWEDTLDIALICGAVAAATWLAYFSTEAARRGSLLWATVPLGFPVADFALLVSCGLLWQSPAYQSGSSRIVGAVGAGVLLLLAGDVYILLARNHLGTDPSALLVHIWFWAFFVVALGAPTRGRSTETPPARNTPTLAKTLLHITASSASLGAAVLLLMVDHARTHRFGGLALGGAIALTALFVARKGVSLARYMQMARENQTLAERLAGFNEELERAVAQRTRTLTALRAVAAATRASLDEATVIRAGAEATARAVEADGAGLWRGREAQPAHISGPEADVALIMEWASSPDAREAPPPFSETGLFVLCRPLPHPEGQNGQLILWRRGQDFTPDEESLVESIGMDVGTALFNAQIHARAADAAERDPVTGLLNHRAIQNQLRSELNRASRSNQTVTVLMMDLDDFKIFNDTFGHPVGDAVLQHIARVLVENTRAFDLIARYGGDEFAAVLPGADGQTAQSIMARVTSILYDAGFEHNGEALPIHMSFGLAVFPDDALSGSDLLSIADARLYQAKRQHGGALSAPVDLRADLHGVPGFAMLDALIAAVDNRDRYTRRHADAVATCVVTLARGLGQSEEDTRNLRVAALLHDVGKVGVPEHILRKPGRLTEEEAETMKRHTEIGHLLVRTLDGLPTAWDGARYHHERWDGQGYPRRLSGRTIPLSARIIAVADAYCAMTTHRPYRRAMEPARALDVLREGAATQWDPDIVAAFVDMVESGIAGSEPTDADEPHSSGAA